MPTKGRNTSQSCTKAGVCTAWVGENGACDKDALCGSGLACVGATATSAGTCMAQSSVLDAPCDPTRRAAADCDKNKGLYCNAGSKTCLAAAYEGIGQTCGLIGGKLRACASGAQCVVPPQHPGTCVPAAADGAACDLVNGPQCLSPARCSNGVCTLPDGASCP